MRQNISLMEKKIKGIEDKSSKTKRVWNKFYVGR